LKFIEGAFQKGSSVIMDIDVQGAKIIKENFPIKL
ncbi:hypothetical protein LEP1GSC124_0002, partial [Leptospira interrogans serovar Pyrogenes str. 200701872]